MSMNCEQTMIEEVVAAVVAFDVSGAEWQAESESAAGGARPLAVC